MNAKSGTCDHSTPSLYLSSHPTAMGLYTRDSVRGAARGAVVTHVRQYQAEVHMPGCRLITRISFLVFVISMGCKSQNDRLFDAIRAKDVEVVRQLLSTGGVMLEPAELPYGVNKPLAYACAYGSLEIVELLVEAGADLNGKTAYGDVPLIKADEHGNADICEYLIRAGADVNIPNAYGISPFIGLCGQDNLELVRLAIDHGASVDAQYMDMVGTGKGTLNFSPLQTAVWEGQKVVVHLLLSCNARTSLKDSQDRTLVQMAELRGHKEIAAMLREHGE